MIKLLNVKDKIMKIMNKSTKLLIYFYTCKYWITLHTFPNCLSTIADIILVHYQIVNFSDIAIDWERATTMAVAIVGIATTNTQTGNEIRLTNIAIANLEN